MIVVLISGKAESGKDLTLEIVKEHLTSLGLICKRLAYGDYVKDTARELYGWNGVKDKAGRGFLQWWGTEYVRCIQNDFWAETVVRLARIIQEDVDYLFVPDLRFPNEITCWQESRIKYLTVRVNRPGHVSKLTPEQLAHVSETALDDWPFDITLTGSTKEELTSEIRKRLIPVLKKGMN